MEEDIPVPQIPEVIVRWLESLFRNEVVPAPMPEWVKCEKAGEQNVIRKLRTEFNRQQRGED